MTCIVGFIDDEYVYMGCDSLGSDDESKVVRKDTKLFKKNNMLIGFVDSFRMGQILQYKLTIPKHPPGVSTDKYMKTLFIDAVMKCFSKNNFMTDDDIGDLFLIGYQGRLFTIGSDFQVGESVENYTSIGIGAYTALGAIIGLLKDDKGIEPSKMLKYALEASEEVMIGVGNPFKIMKIKKG